MARGTAYAGRLLIEQRSLALAVLIIGAGTVLAVAHLLFHRRLSER